MNRAWITNPAHPHYPEQGTVVHLNGQYVILELSAWPIHGARIAIVAAKDVQPVKYV